MRVNDGGAKPKQRVSPGERIEDRTGRRVKKSETRNPSAKGPKMRPMVTDVRQVQGEVGLVSRLGLVLQAP